MSILAIILSFLTSFKYINTLISNIIHNLYSGSEFYGIL